MVVQRRRDRRAAAKLMCKLLKGHGFTPTLIVTDKLRSYARGLPASRSRLSSRTRPEGE
jgi:transposase-like protein